MKSVVALMNSKLTKAVFALLMTAPGLAFASTESDLPQSADSCKALRLEIETLQLDRDTLTFAIARSESPSDRDTLIDQAEALDKKISASTSTLESNNCGI